MDQATVTFAVGVEQVTVVLTVDLNDIWLISGDFSGTIPQGQIGFINGNVNLTGDLIVEGLLTGIDTFTLEGNGHQILTQDGGQLNLQGVEKSGWVHWGDTPVGWQIGDRLRVSGTAPNVFIPFASTWQGTWDSTVRPASCPDVLLPNGVTVRPEVANVDRSIRLKNLSRIHFHDGAGVQTIKHLMVLDAGVTNVLAKYPLHFHLCGETVRGSLVEGVVIENGKNHAFVVHGSHGVTLRDTVAYNTFQDAYWWDLPTSGAHTINNSNDTLYDHCLAMYVRGSVGADQVRLSAFLIGAGSGNVVVNSVACCVQGGQDGSGFHWPEQANNNVGGTVWEFAFNVAHNNKNDGIFVWQNDNGHHSIDDYIGYRNGLSQIDHGAYTNNYDYKRNVLMGGSEAGFKFHAWGGILLEDVLSDKPLRMMKHASPASTFAVVRRCTFPLISYTETGDGGINRSLIRYEDCDLTPANFSMTGAVQSSIAEIYEAGVLTHRWTAGVWT